MSPPGADRPDGASGETWTIVVAGGSGLRFGARKQFVELAGTSVLQRAVDAAAPVSDGIVAVVPADALTTTRLVVAGGTRLELVAGGATRAASVRAGLGAVPETCGCVVVHDAARPLASTTLFERVLDAVGEGADAAVPAVAVTDTIRHVGGGTVERADLLAVQTPQAFPIAALRRAHDGGAEATDDASLVEAAGGRVVVVAGEVENRKITDPVDVITAEAVLSRNGAAR